MKIYNVAMTLTGLKSFFSLLTPSPFLGQNIINRHMKSLLVPTPLYALQLFSSSGSDINQQVLHHIALAALALKDKNFAKAEGILADTLKTAEEQECCSGVTCVYDMLATIAYKQGDVERAEDLLIMVLDRLITGGTHEDDNLVVSFCLKLSRLYSSKGEDDLAEFGYKHCLSVQRGKIERRPNTMEEEDGLLWLTSLYWYGKFLGERKRYREAKTCFEDCFSICARVGLVLPGQVMVILFNLGEICHAMGDMDEALKYMRNAIVLGKTFDSPDLPLFYAKVGMLYLHKGIYDEAKLWCGKGREAARTLKTKEADKELNECLEKLRTLAFV